MKNYILIIFMVATILLSGCSTNNNEDETVNNNNGDNTVDQTVVETGTEDDDDDSDIGLHEVNVYLFYSASCSHCHSEREWISSVEDEYPYVNFIMYEVSEYSELFEQVTAGFGLDNSYVPVTIIGNNYMVGYSEAKNRKFIRYFNELSTFESCDVVQTIIDGKDVEACMSKNETN